MGILDLEREKSILPKIVVSGVEERKTGLRANGPFGSESLSPLNYAGLGLGCLSVLLLQFPELAATSRPFSVRPSAA